MASTGIQGKALAAAIKTVPASEPLERARTRVPGLDPTQERSQVRHLVIFRAPIVGFGRP
jgi:hypothetical protein